MKLIPVISFRGRFRHDLNIVLATTKFQKEITPVHKPQLIVEEEAEIFANVGLISVFCCPQ
jgi:hypothetical protein